MLSRAIDALSEPERLALGRTLILLADADGQRQAEEVAFIERVATALGINPQTLLDGVDVRTLEEVLQPVTSREAQKAILCELIRLGHADGDYCDDERRRVREVAQLMKLSEAEVVALESEIQAEQRP